MSDATARFALPLLAAGQAQKEITHNEALVLLDMLTQPIVESASLASPPATPGIGQIWIVAVGGTGAWAGRSGALALWTEGGWRFVAPVVGMRVIVGNSGLILRCGTSAWESGAAIGAATGGTVIDVQARAAITAIITALQQGGLIEA